MRFDEKTASPSNTVVHFADGSSMSVVGAIATVASDLGGDFTAEQLHPSDPRFGEAASIATDGNNRPLYLANFATRYAVTTAGRQDVQFDRFKATIVA